MKSIKGGKHPNSGNLKTTDDVIKAMQKMLEQPKKNKIVIQNTSGVKYSQLLLEMVEPYFEFPEPDMEELEYLLDMGVAAWNLSVYKKHEPAFYKEAVETLFKKAGMPKETYDLIKKLIDYKQKNHREEHVLLIDFEVKEEDAFIIDVAFAPFEGIIRNIFAESMDARLQKAAQEMEMEEEEVDIPLADRICVTIKPKEPFFKWLKTTYLPEEDEAPESLQENNVYLIPEDLDDEPGKKWLKKNFDIIFAHELNDWHTDENDWPQKRTWKLFQEWFAIEINSMVFDLG
jgi:hypothetical protein